MYSVAVIGDKDSVAGFGTLGLDTYFTDTREECRKTFKQLGVKREICCYLYYRKSFGIRR